MTAEEDKGWLPSIRMAVQKASIGMKVAVLVRGGVDTTDGMKRLDELFRESSLPYRGGSISFEHWISIHKHVDFDIIIDPWGLAMYHLMRSEPSDQRRSVEEKIVVLGTRRRSRCH